MKIPVIFILALLLSFSCKKDKEEPSKENEILSFSIGNRKATIKGTEVFLSLPYNYSIKSLSPSITLSKNARVSPVPGLAQNFTEPVLYTVTAEDGSIQVYTVTVEVVSNSKNDILKFELAKGYDKFVGIIDTTQPVIKIPIPFYLKGTKNFITNIQISDSATINPPADSEFQFDGKPKEYNVTAQNGDEKTYTVYLQNSDNYVSSFTFPGLTEYASFSNDLQVTIVPILSNVDVSNLCPSITIPENATITPANGACGDFSKDVVYTVTSESGYAEKYVIRLEKRTIIIQYEDVDVYYSLYNGYFSFGYRAICSIDSAQLIKVASGQVVSCNVKSEEKQEGTFPQIAKVYPLKGSLISRNSCYKLKMFMSNGEAIVVHKELYF